MLATNANFLKTIAPAKYNCRADLARGLPVSSLCIRVLILQTITLDRMSWSSPFIQGSYGVVKLAYNENDNTYYVSTHTSLPAPILVQRK